MIKKLLSAALALALILVLAVPAMAFPIPLDPITDLIIDEILATKPPPPPTPAPTPAPTEPPKIKLPGFGDSVDSIHPIATESFYQTFNPDLIIRTIRPDLVPTVKPPQPTKAPPQATAKPQPQPTAKPTAKPPATQKGSNQKAAEVTSFGLYFEELRPKLTDKWYMGTPIDLSQEGVNQYPLVASNAHIIGNAQVTVLGGKLLVSYQAVSGVKVGSEFFTIFRNLDEIQTLSVKLLAPQARAFGQPIDIQQSFGDDRKVILYLFLTADYSAKGPGITAFVPDQQRPFMQFLMANLD